jgi:hypothetical protein
VSACTWVEGAVSNIVTITSKDGSSSTGGGGGSNNSSGSTLGAGAIAGIVIGCVALLALIVAAIVFCILRRRKARSYTASEPEPSQDLLNGPVFNFGVEPKLPSQEYRESQEALQASQASQSIQASQSAQDSPARTVGEAIVAEHGLELDGQDTHIRPDAELDASEPQIHQLHGQSSGESSSQPPRNGPVYHELPAGDVGRAKLDSVSAMGTPPQGRVSGDKPSPHSGGASEEVDDEPSSPFVSTMGSEGRRSESEDSPLDLVSPTTPVHHLRHPFTMDPEDLHDP